MYIMCVCVPMSYSPCRTAHVATASLHRLDLLRWRSISVPSECCTTDVLKDRAPDKAETDRGATIARLGAEMSRVKQSDTMSRKSVKKWIVHVSSVHMDDMAIKIL